MRRGERICLFIVICVSLDNLGIINGPVIISDYQLSYCEILRIAAVSMRRFIVYPCVATILRDFILIIFLLNNLF